MIHVSFGVEGLKRDLVAIIYHVLNSVTVILFTLISNVGWALFSITMPLAKVILRICRGLWISLTRSVGSRMYLSLLNMVLEGAIVLWHIVIPIA